MKKKNIVLLAILLIVVVICILAVVIRFVINDDGDKKDKKPVKLSENLLEEETTTDEADEKSTTVKESEEDTTSAVSKETESDTTYVVEQETTEDTTETDTTKQEEIQELNRYSYEYMIIDGKSVYLEFNSKLMDLYESINKARLEAGVPQLTFDKEISYIACAKASQISYENVVENNQKMQYYEFMKMSKVVFTKAAENTAAGYGTAEDVVSGNSTSWKTSERHYQNLISVDYTRVGVGVDYSETMGYIWVAIFSN